MLAGRVPGRKDAKSYPNRKNGEEEQATWRQRYLEFFADGIPRLVETTRCCNFRFESFGNVTLHLTFHRTYSSLKKPRRAFCGKLKLYSKSSMNTLGLIPGCQKRSTPNQIKRKTNNLEANIFRYSRLRPPPSQLIHFSR